MIQQGSALREEVLYVIFLDLHKACDASDRSRCLDILEGYGLFHQACWLLWTYCRWLMMVARSGRYYVADLKGDQVVTQGEPLSPTILNVVVDMVVQYWVAVMVEGSEDKGECGQEVRNRNSLLYADYVMVASSDPRWL